MRSACLLPALSLSQHGSLDQRREVDHRLMRRIALHALRDETSTTPTAAGEFHHPHCCSGGIVVFGATVPDWQAALRRSSQAFREQHVTGVVLQPGVFLLLQLFAPCLLFTPSERGRGIPGST